MTARNRSVRDLAALIVTLAATLVVFMFVIGNDGSERKAVRHLPDGERRVLYERTLENLVAPCAPAKHAAGLDAFCRAQAEFILGFSECDEACAALARPHLRAPSR